MKRSPIYLFYETVGNGPDGTWGDDGDIHYHCFHGAHKICISKKKLVLFLLIPFLPPK